MLKEEMGNDMIVVICIDEKGGLMFHGRRQSQDRVLREDVLKECGNILHMNAYSAAMFGKDTGVSLRVSEDFMEEAGENEYCFVEDGKLDEYRDRIEAVILYRWNRKYPADVYFTWSLTGGGWELERIEELVGSSHDCITKEVYRRTI